MRNSAVFCGAAALLLATAGASAQWSDNFDSYADGTVLDGVGGWGGWNDDPNAAGVVSDDQSLSSPHSISVSGTGDAVHPFSGYASGVWTFTAYQYIPDTLDGLTYFILNNEYSHNGAQDWAVEMHMDPATGLVNEAIHDPNATVTTPIVYNEWVEIRTLIDLDNNYMENYYNGVLLASGAWNIRTGGLIELQNVDLYAPHDVDVYFDDLSLASPDDCFADYNGDDIVDTRDVLAYLNDWNAQDPAADCDGNALIDTRDVLCFLNLWTGGC